MTRGRVSQVVDVTICKMSHGGHCSGLTPPPHHASKSNLLPRKPSAVLDGAPFATISMNRRTAQLRKLKKKAVFQLLHVTNCQLGHYCHHSGFTPHGGKSNLIPLRPSAVLGGVSFGTIHTFQ